MNKLANFTLALTLSSVAGLAGAKLPAPSDEAKAKAAEAAAKANWTNNVGNYQLCKAQDKVAAAYFAESRKTGKPAQPPASAPAACVDPGPFAYTPPENKPLEASGAHSPPGMATTPPSTSKPAAENPPKK